MSWLGLSALFFFRVRNSDTVSPWEGVDCAAALLPKLVHPRSARGDIVIQHVTHRVPFPLYTGDTAALATILEKAKLSGFAIS